MSLLGHVVVGVKEEEVVHSLASKVVPQRAENESKGGK